MSSSDWLHHPTMSFCHESCVPRAGFTSGETKSPFSSAIITADYRLTNIKNDLSPRVPRAARECGDAALHGLTPRSRWEGPDGEPAPRPAPRGSPWQRCAPPEPRPGSPCAGAACCAARAAAAWNARRVTGCAVKATGYGGCGSHLREESLILKQREDGRDAFYMLFNRGPAQSLMQFLKEEVTRFANDHLAPSHWGLGGGGGGQCLLPISLWKEHRGRGMRQDAWEPCVSPRIRLYVCLLKTPFRAARVSSYYPSLHLDLF